MDQVPPPDSSQTAGKRSGQQSAPTQAGERPPSAIIRDGGQEREVGVADVDARRPFNVIWLVPIVALLIAAFLGYRALQERGPTITISFRSADGIVAGQTRVKHKAVDLGTVRAIDLSPDMSHVEVRVDMRREASRVLTDHARFWVVRARLNAANVSGLDTLVSGSYIELDPGMPDGKSQTEFTGLEDPPAIRSDEPGTTFTLKADRIGSVGSGSPVFYRDIAAGEILGYDLGPDGNGVTIHVFVRAPFDKFVRNNTHFWNESGLSVNLGAQGVSVRVASLQALISGAVAFDTPVDEKPGAATEPGAVFTLFPDASNASSAGYHQRIPFRTYVEGSVRGLQKGAPVLMFGIQVGTVTDVKLQFDPDGLTSRVAIDMDVEPERFMRPDQVSSAKPIDVSRALVKRGLRVQLQTTNYLTGQMAIAFVFQPETPADDVKEQDGAIVLPSVAGGLDSVTSSLSDLANKLARLPLDEIAKNLDATLSGTSKLTNGPQVTQALTSMSDALVNVQDLVKKLDSGLTPTMKRLPEIAQALQQSLDRVSKLVASADTGYGASSEFKRNIERLLNQVSDTARSVRLLADYLDQHPEALIRGRTDRAGDR